MALDPVILVISSDAYFAQPLMQQVINELSIPCAVAANMDAAKPFKPSIALVVTNNGAIDDCPCPVLEVKEPPFKMQALLSEISSMRGRQSSDEISLGSVYRLQPRQKELLYVPSKKAVALTDKEVKLLQCFASGDVVSKEQLMKDVWETEVALDTHTLETHIYRLRAKFRELDNDEVIIAEDGGYRMAI